MVGGSSNGGFQNYTVAKASIVSHLPDHIPYAAGVVLPLALMTASMALYPVQRLGLSLPSCPSTQEAQSRNKTLLVWGGSSSAGSAAVQLAVASGVNVVATTSHKNHELVKSLGATAVLDYNDPDITVNLVEAITAIGAELVGALDSIASEKTAKGFDSGIPDDVEVLPSKEPPPSLLTSCADTFDTDICRLLLHSDRRRSHWLQT
jgi:NADPH:quinone reductase-like Zn-dependent oxidoreductase